MNRPLAALALAGLFAAAAPLAADEVPHLEFVRELRARYPDLALEYLDKLKKANPPPDVAAAIPYELAKTHLDLANGEADNRRRLDLFNKARAELQEFIDKNPNNFLVADARVDLARVTALQAKAQLSRALTEEDPAAREKGALEARQTFLQANAQLQAAADKLAGDVAKLGEPKTPQETAAKRALQQAQLQARLDIGTNFIDQAETYVNEGNAEVALARSKVINQAQAALGAVVKDAEQNNPIGWQARAWVAYCAVQNGDPVKALRGLDAVINATEPGTGAGKRLAYFFKMRILLDPPANPKEADLATVRAEAEKWLSDFRSFQNTPEGCGVRYYLADVLFRQAADAKDKAARTKDLNKGRDLCLELTRTDNEYSLRARHLGIKIIGAEGGFNKDIARLTSFEECLIRAEYEGSQAEELAHKQREMKPEEFDKEWNARIGHAVEALKLALDYAGRPGSKVTPAEAGKARSMLCGYYLFTKKFKEAIAVGEDAARAVPPTAQSAKTAEYVIEAYNEYLGESLRTGTTLADLAEPVDRMDGLAQFMIKQWPGEPPGDVARHMRGLLLIKQKKHPEAVEVLAKVSPKYPSLIYVKSSLALAAAQVAQDREALAKAEPDKSKKEQLLKEQAQYEQQALDALKTMPPLPARADALSARIYVKSKLDLASALYRRKEYAEIDKVVDPLLAGIADGSVRLDTGDEKPDQPKPTKEARDSLLLVKLYGKYGAAESELAAGHTAKVKAITDPIVDEIRKGGHAELEGNPTLRWGLMGLALKVSIQEGNTGRALEIYEAAKKFATPKEGDKAGNSKVILLQIAGMVKDQAREAKQKKDNDALKKYTQFLDKLRDGEKEPTPEFRRVVAEGYAALGQHDAAVEQTRLVPAPAGDDAKDERKVSNYHFCRILRVRELRLAGTKDKKEESKAELEILIQKEPWAKDHPEVVKEKIHLLPPGKAYGEWLKLVNQLQAKIQQPGMKEQYFECYFNMVQSLVNFANEDANAAKKDDYLKRAAGQIVKLEKPWPDLGGDDSKARFTDLLEREPALKEQYDKAKGDK
jgi:hypothetical protein